MLKNARQIEQHIRRLIGLRRRVKIAHQSKKGSSLLGEVETWKEPPEVYMYLGPSDDEYAATLCHELLHIKFTPLELQLEIMLRRAGVSDEVRGDQVIEIIDRLIEEVGEVLLKQTALSTKHTIDVMPEASDVPVL